MLAGVISAPGGFVIARAVHKGLGNALGVAAPNVATLLFVLALLIKATQYGLLGWAIVRIAASNRATLRTFVGVGLLSGIIFGGAFTIVQWFFAHPSPRALAMTAVNEVFFPVGCAMVLYVVDLLSRRVPAPAPSASPSPVSRVSNPS
jgi:hypothetical protein